MPSGIVMHVGSDGSLKVDDDIDVDTFDSDGVGWLLQDNSLFSKPGITF